MTVDIENLKKQIVKSLISLNPEKIILFGSYAYGTPDENSDLDIMIIDKDYDNKYNKIKEARELLDDIKLSKDILLEKKDFFESHISEDWINTAWYDANKYGKILYEKR